MVCFEAEKFNILSVFIKKKQCKSTLAKIKKNFKTLHLKKMRFLN